MLFRVFRGQIAVNSFFSCPSVYSVGQKSPLAVSSTGPGPPCVREVVSKMNVNEEPGTYGTVEQISANSLEWEIFEESELQ